MSVWLVETMLATTLLMALVMMVRRPAARWLGAGTAYLLWVLPLARMLMPALPGDLDPSPLHRAVDRAGLADLLAATPSVPSTLTPSALAPTAAASIPWLEIGLSLWFAGVIAFLLVQLVGYGRFRRHMLSGATPIDTAGRIRIITSPHASGPLAFGVLRPYIVLPADFALRYDSQEQDMAIAHERAHHERGDLAANMVALALLALHWCNPVAWFAYRAYRADQETACDARVLSLYGRDQAHIYGRAILKAAGGRQFAAACHLTRIATLKGRLKMLSNHDLSLRRISWGMAAVALVTAAGLALTASGSRAAQQMAVITGRMERADFARLTDLVTPPAADRDAALSPTSVSVGAPGATAAVTPVTPQAPATPAMSLARRDAGSWAPPAPAAPPALPAPPAPVVPAADMIAPVPPMPPAPPLVRSENGRITVTHSDGRIETHRIPTQAEIARMVPQVDVREGCEAGRNATTRSESVDADGRRQIRVRICTAAVERAAARSADMARLQADRAARQADFAMARADRAARTAHAGALSGLRTARAQIARNRSMPADAQAEALREIDASIAEIRSQQP